MKFLYNLKLHPLTFITIVVITCLICFTAIILPVKAQVVGDPPTPIVSPQPTDEMPILQLEIRLPYISK